MLKTKSSEKLERTLSYFPTDLAEEIRRIMRQRKDEIREIRIRTFARSTVICGDESLTLFSHVDKSSVDALVERLLDGALYAHRDSIASGYISIDGGIRVGICGHARYDGERLVGGRQDTVRELGRSYCYSHLPEGCRRKLGPWRACNYRGRQESSARRHLRLERCLRYPFFHRPCKWGDRHIYEKLAL